MGLGSEIRDLGSVKNPILDPESRGKKCTGSRIRNTGFSCSENHLCTDDLYGPMRNSFDAGRYLCGEVVGELALEI